MDNYAYQPEENNGKQPYTITTFVVWHCTICSDDTYLNNGYPTSTARPPQNDYLVEVNSRSKLLKRPRFLRGLSICLIILVFVLLLVLAALAILYAEAQTNHGLCTTDECLRSAANLRYSMDFSVNPCDDFYQYTCGHWTEEHPNHGWFPSFSTFATISERILISTENFLADDEDVDKLPLPVKQSKDFYQSCMDVDAIDQLGLSVLVKYLEQAELPLVPSLFTKTENEIADFKFDWLKAETIIKKLFSMDVLVGFVVDANNFNRSENVMYIGVPGQQCPLPSPLTSTGKRWAHKHKKNEEGDEDDDEYEKLKKKAGLNIITFVLKTVIQNVTGEPPKEDTLQLASQVLLNMTTYIDEAITNYTDYDDYEIQAFSIKDYQAKTNEILLNNINKEYPQIWEKYVTFLFEGTNVTIDLDKDLLYVGDAEIEYLPKMMSYILTTSDVYLELYMWWVTVFAMIINTSSDVVEYLMKQTTPFYPGTPVLRSRSLDCAALVNSFMGMAVSYGIADRAFPNKTKPKVERMLYDIKSAFVEHVNGLTWMDKDTKRQTLEKSKEMLSFIGYPEWLFEKGALDTYYKGIVMGPDTYLENMMSMIKVYVPSKLAELRNSNERDWRTDPTTVNAFNSFPDNAINVPMAILTFPIYNLGLEMLNYGAIGSVLGHELTHGFDNTGRKHDKFGNYKQWWTNETIETFEGKIQCFIKQYDNFTIDGIGRHIQGKKTLGENLADNGGLNHAYVAYQHYLQKFGSERHLPGFENFTSNQMFFIAFGSIWCETTSLDDLENQLLYDEHCPNNIRVLGTLQNSAYFAKAFNCPTGSYMNPEKEKCKVW